MKKDDFSNIFEAMRLPLQQIENSKDEEGRLVVPQFSNGLVDMTGEYVRCEIEWDKYDFDDCFQNFTRFARNIFIIQRDYNLSLKDKSDQDLPDNLWDFWEIYLKPCRNSQLRKRLNTIAGPTLICICRRVYALCALDAPDVVVIHEMESLLRAFFINEYATSWEDIYIPERVEISDPGIIDSRKED